MTPLSPELVLVAPTDAAARARGALPVYPPFPALRAAAGAPRRRLRLDRGLATFCAVCVCATLVPFALAVTFGR